MSNKGEIINSPGPTLLKGVGTFFFRTMHGRCIDGLNKLDTKESNHSESFRDILLPDRSLAFKLRRYHLQHLRL
jgi:hypothetical protein